MAKNQNKYELPKISCGLSPKQVANQKFLTFKEMKPVKMTGDPGFHGKITNPLK